MVAMLRQLSLLLALAAVLLPTHAIRFYLEPGQRRCFTEELPSMKLITGVASVAAGKGDMDVDVWITTLAGKVLYHKRAAEHGRFSFHTPAVPSHHDGIENDEYDYADEESEEDTFKICIEHQQPPSSAHPPGTRRLVEFYLHQTFNGAPRGFDDAAKASDTDKLQARMRDIHTTLSGMIGDLSQLQRRERTLTNRVQMSASRVTFLAVVSVLVTLLTSALQFRYYKGYFKQKKLC